MRIFLPAFLSNHPVLGKYASRATVLFHGSTMMGVDDKGSDLDFWLILPERSCRRCVGSAGTSFFGFECKGKPGHLNAISIGEFRDSIARCDMDIIYQLRSSVVIRDCKRLGSSLIRTASRPMRPSVRKDLFFYYYTEMRGEHRSADNPMARGDSVSVLLAVSKTLTMALRAAIVLEAKPFPYDKWLFHAAMDTPTGRLIAPEVRTVLTAIRSGWLERKAVDRKNPAGVALREIRFKLVKAAQKKGIDEPWLKEWWLFIPQAREARKNVRW
jgi:hypothetical protein